MISSALDIIKHTFQVSLKEEFGLPVLVNTTLTDKSSVSVMRQSTLYEYMDQGPIPAEPVWTEIIITLTPNIIEDPESLYEAYSTIRSKITKTLAKGKVMV